MISQNTHSQPSGELEELAALYGVQTVYRDSLGRERASPRESVAMILGALGADVGEASRLKAAIRGREAELSSRAIEPVLVAWEGVLPDFAVRLPAGGPDSADATLTLEDGQELQWKERRASLGTIEQHGAGRGLPMRRLPFGYHRLRLDCGGLAAEATVISAPRRCWAPPPAAQRAWGVFAPLYALPSERGRGVADLADLETLRAWVGGAGGSTVATLPLLPAYLDRPFEPSPYRPVSRRFWNEFYLPTDRAPERGGCTAARELRSSALVRDRLAALATRSLVDYREAMAVKRPVLQELSRCFFATADATRREAFFEHLRSNRHHMEYASFRASVEREAADWRVWSDERSAALAVEQLRRLPAERWTAGATDAERYHAFCQWRMEEQMAHLSRAGDAPAPLGLFLDLPVGVHPGGFDTWRWPESFVREMSFGAPPDSFFGRGQDWDSPPLHPERMREQGHQYFAGCVGHHARHARYLRIDHVMSLHRLFWIPRGAEPADGVYVTYPEEELYAVLCVESHRHQALVIGEDLGTVPAGTRAAMRRHGILGTWVLQSALRPRGKRPLPSVPRHVVAGLNTHDMFPFAGFARGDDIPARSNAEQSDQKAVEREIAARHRVLARLGAWLSVGTKSGDIATPGGTAALFRAAVAYLAASPAALVLVSLDDLMRETRPQNVPGTGSEQGNWQRKIAGSPADVRRAIARAAVMMKGR